MVVNKIIKVSNCCHCYVIKPDVKLNIVDGTFHMKLKDSKYIDITEDKIHNIFDSILDEDIELMGLNPEQSHPRNLIITALPVLPIIARPPLYSGGRICDDDITNQYIEIIKYNNKASTEINEEKKSKYLSAIKSKVRTIMNNSNCKIKDSNGKPLKGIKERITGKGGHIRNNMMGKRVNQSARTVIGPDPTIRLDEIVVPEQIANVLTVSERVSKYNIDVLRQIIKNGRANFVVKGGTKSRINLKYALSKERVELQRGDKISRDGVMIDVGDTYFKHNDVVGHVIKSSNRFVSKFYTADRFELKKGDKIIRGDVS